MNWCCVLVFFLHLVEFNILDNLINFVGPVWVPLMESDCIRYVSKQPSDCEARSSGELWINFEHLGFLNVHINLST